MKQLTALAISLLFCGTLAAQMPPRPPEAPQPPDRPGMPPQPPMPPGDPIERQLFPPEMIMNHQEELRLTDTQRSALRTEVVRLQTKIVDMQWQLSEEAERLASMLRNAPIDEAKALEQADKVMALEHDIKRLHLGTLIRIKNILTPDQMAKLRDLRNPQPPRR